VHGGILETLEWMGFATIQLSAQSVTWTYILVHMSCARLVRSVYSSVPHVIDRGVQKPLAMNVTFLGTSSGGGPTLNRNCSSLVCDFFEGNNLWSWFFVVSYLLPLTFNSSG